MLPMLTPSMESFRPYGPSPLFGSDHEWDATQQALRVTVFGYGSPFSGSCSWDAMDHTEGVGGFFTPLSAVSRLRFLTA